MIIKIIAIDDEVKQYYTPINDMLVTDDLDDMLYETGYELRDVEDHLVECHGFIAGKIERDGNRSWMVFKR